MAESPQTAPLERPESDEAPLPGPEAYLRAHRLHDVIQYLTFALSVQKPENHIQFIRNWLANLNAAMEANGTAESCFGINLLAIDGYKEVQPPTKQATSTVEGDMPTPSPLSASALASPVNQSSPPSKTAPTPPGVPHSVVLPVRRFTNPGVYRYDDPMFSQSTSLTPSTQKLIMTLENLSIGDRFRAIEMIERFIESLPKAAVPSSMNSDTIPMHEPTVVVSGPSPRATRRSTEAESKFAQSAEEGELVTNETIDIGFQVEPPEEEGWSTSERDDVKRVLSVTTVFAGFASSEYEDLIHIMQRQKLQEGEFVAKQGEPTSGALYVILRGAAEVTKDGKHARKLVRGEYFGVLDPNIVDDSESYAVSVIVTSPEMLLGIVAKEDFDHNIRDHVFSRRSRFESDIVKADFWKGLPPHARNYLSEALNPVTFKKGEVILRSGEHPAYMFVLFDGVACVLDDLNALSSELRTFVPGDLVGEVELLFHHKTVSNVKAKTDIRAAALPERFFSVCFEPMKSTIKKAAAHVKYSYFRHRASVAVQEEIAAQASQAAARRRSAEPVVLPGEVSSRGEMLIPLSRTRIARYPLGPTKNYGLCLAAVDTNGIITWGEGLAHAIGRENQRVNGRSLLHLIEDDAEKSEVMEMIKNAAGYAGRWTEFVGTNPSPRILALRHGNGMTNVHLKLLALPQLSLSTGTRSTTVLLCGHELKQQVASEIRFSEWLMQSLEPHVLQLEMIGQEICQKIPEIYNDNLCRIIGRIRRAISLYRPLNNAGEAIQITTLADAIVDEVRTEVEGRKNEIQCVVGPSVPLNPIFTDIERLRKVLLYLLRNPNRLFTGIKITLEVELVIDLGSGNAPRGPTPKDVTESMRSRRSVDSASALQNFGERIASFANVNSSVRGMLTKSVMGATSRTINVQSIAYTVRDNGDAAPQEIVDMINDPDSKFDENKDGSGLMRCRSLISAMGGEMIMDSEPGVGTAITVLAPLLQTGAGKDPLKAQAKSDKLFCERKEKPVSFTTVIIEPNLYTRNVLVNFLWSRRHSVFPASNWADVQHSLQTGNCDILIANIEQSSSSTPTQPGEGLRSLLGEEVQPLSVLQDYSNKIAVILCSDEFNEKDLKTPSTAEFGGSSSTTPPSQLLTLSRSFTLAQLTTVVGKAEARVKTKKAEIARINKLRQTFARTSKVQPDRIRMLGKGAFGEVWEVVDSRTGGKMAMKCFRVNLENKEKLKELADEIDAMTPLQHQNIIHYFSCNQESETSLNLFMELAVGGTLDQKIKQAGPGGLPFEPLVRYLRDIVNGLIYVHANQFVHCDLKPANILLDGTGRCKIGDFGTAKKLRIGEALYVMRGTPRYMAPEVMNADPDEKKSYDFPADIWSIGCVVLEMATGFPPLSHLQVGNSSAMALINYVSELTDTPDLSPLFDKHPFIFEFVKACMEVAPGKRPTAKKLLGFPLLTAGTDDCLAVATKLLEKAKTKHELRRTLEASKKTPSMSGSQQKSFFDSDDEGSTLERRQSTAENSVAATSQSMARDPYSGPVAGSQSALAQTNDFFDSDED